MVKYEFKVQKRGYTDYEQANLGCFQYLRVKKIRWFNNYTI